MENKTPIKTEIKRSLVDVPMLNIPNITYAILPHTKLTNVTFPILFHGNTKVKDTFNNFEDHNNCNKFTRKILAKDANAGPIKLNIL